MSSTSAVSVLAQGLRELRDFAEGPDGEELRERTGLSAEQIDAALAGERLPTREVTLALVEAWDGDVEAWRGYWGQIEELAEQDEAGHAKTTPVPPEPSIITPMVTEGAGEGEPEPERESATEERDPAAAEQGLATAEQEEQSKAGGPEVEQAEGHQEEDTEVEQADAENGETEPVAAKPAEAKPVAEAAASDQSTAKAPAPARAESPAAEPQPAKSSFLTRIGIPILVFAIGVGVGAFADHALNSKQTSTSSVASLPPVSSPARSSHTVALSPSGSGGTPSSSASSPASSGSGPTSATDTTPTGASAPADTANSATSTVAAGTMLGAYVNIQLASGYSVNFLSDAYHPAPGTADGPDTMGFFAGSFVDGRFYADRVAILDPTDTGSYTSCLNDTRYQHDVLLSQIATDSSFCVTTGTGHLVLVTVRRMPSSTDANPYAVLDVTVWQTS